MHPTGERITDRAQSAAPSWLFSGRIPGLDGLRAAAIALVLLSHATATRGFPFGHRFAPFDHVGALGVDLFFCISGFLITLLLIREWSRTGGISLRQFYLRRALRILPAYAVYLFALFLLTRAHAVEISGGSWLRALTYTISLGWRQDLALGLGEWQIAHLWSLCVEEHFYLVWPVAMALLARKRAPYLALGVFLAMPVLRAVLTLVGMQPFTLDFFTFTRLSSISAGCLLAFAASHPEWRDRLFAAGNRALPVGAAAALFLYVFDTFVWSHWQDNLLRVAFRDTLAGLGSVLIIWSALNQRDNGIARLLNARPVVWLGVISYSLYVWQQPFMNGGGGRWLCRFPINLILALVMACLSYYMVEKPFLRLKERISRDEKKLPMIEARVVLAGAE